MGVKYSFAAHLRDTGTVRCLVCPTLRENWLMFYFEVWFYASGTMDTTRWRRNNKDDRILGRLYHREGVPLKPVKKNKFICPNTRATSLYDNGLCYVPVQL